MGRQIDVKQAGSGSSELLLPLAPHRNAFVFLSSAPLGCLFVFLFCSLFHMRRHRGIDVSSTHPFIQHNGNGRGRQRAARTAEDGNHLSLEIY